MSNYNNRNIRPLGHKTPIKPIKVAIRLGHPDDDRRIRVGFTVIGTGNLKVYDFGPNVTVPYKNEFGQKLRRAPKYGDWFVRFTDNTWRIYSPKAYNSYKYLLSMEAERQAQTGTAEEGTL